MEIKEGEINKGFKPSKEEYQAEMPGTLVS
jgi:hypothetical protein